jgi:hypothetical protein
VVQEREVEVLKKKKKKKEQETDGRHDLSKLQKFQKKPQTSLVARRLGQN